MGERILFRYRQMLLEGRVSPSVRLRTGGGREGSKKTEKVIGGMEAGREGGGVGRVDKRERESGAGLGVRGCERPAGGRLNETCGRSVRAGEAERER